MYLNAISSCGDIVEHERRACDQRLQNQSSGEVLTFVIDARTRELVWPRDQGSEEFHVWPE